MCRLVTSYVIHDMFLPLQYGEPFACNPCFVRPELLVTKTRLQRKRINPDESVVISFNVTSDLASGGLSHLPRLGLS